MKNQAIVCITGPDGAGKTTQLARLAEHIESSAKLRVACVTIWDLFRDPDFRGKIPFRAPAEVDLYMSALCPAARTHFLFHCMHQALDAAMKKVPSVVLVNAYWYKYYATEIAHGGDPGRLAPLASAFPVPTVTYYLKLVPEACFDRKTSLSGYETGFAGVKTKEAFVSFQREAHRVLDALSAELGWMALDGGASEDEVSAAIQRHFNSGEGPMAMLQPTGAPR